MKLHCFGHIHSCNGFIRKGNTIFLNASLCEEYVNDIVDNKPFYLTFNCLTKVILNMKKNEFGLVIILIDHIMNYVNKNEWKGWKKE